MGAGIAGLGAVVVWLHLTTPPRVPEPGEVRLISILTTAVMGWTLAGIAVGEFIWRRQVRVADHPARIVGAARTGFVARLAVREGTALLGLVACFLAARGGVLRAFPAYWVNAVPAVLFLFFLYARWPTLENLRSQVVDILPFV